MRPHGRRGWLLLLLLLTGAGVTTATLLLLLEPDQGATARERAGWLAPDQRGPQAQLDGVALDGTPVAVAKWVGLPVVINVWGSWCAPCRQEAPVLASAHGSYSKLGVRFLGVNVKDNKAAAQAFERQNGIGYPSIDDRGGRAVLQLSTYVPPAAVPVTIVLDRRGRVAFRVLGVVPAAELRAALDDVLAETP